MEGRSERRMPMSYTPFRPSRPSNSTSAAQSNQKRHTNSRSRSELKVSSSRILNKDGSIPVSTDELVARGFEILREQREKRRREKEEAPPRIVSDSSSKSSATYVCNSPTVPSDRPNLSLPQALQDSRRYTSSQNLRSTVPIESQDTEVNFRASLESHEANIQAMKAEIAALKRAAILTRELRHEAILEQSSRTGHRTELRRQKGPLELRSVNEALMSGGNGTGSEEDTMPRNRQPPPVKHIFNESMEGMPTPPQLLPFESREKQTTETRHSHRSQRKQEKRPSTHEKLCLCPNCISITQQVVNTLAARYTKQETSSNSQTQPSKPPRIDPKSYYRCRSHPATIGTKIDTRRSVPNMVSPRKGKENSDPRSASPDYMQKLKEMSEVPCDCYSCKLKANLEEFERKNAIFPPIKNGVWAKGENAEGWFW